MTKKKCNDLGRVINGSRSSRTETQCFYWAIYRLSANYVLPTTYFSKALLHKTQAQAHSAMVSWSGYGQTMANAIIYEHKKMEAWDSSTCMTTKAMGRLSCS